MSLVNKIFKRGADEHRGNGLATREPDRLPGKSPQGSDRNLERIWDDFERDPWAVMHDPLSMVRHLNGRFDALANWPVMDVSENESEMVVRCDVPGVDAGDVNVEVSGNVLTVSGAREDEWSGKKHGIHRRERISGAFSRSVKLPPHVDGSKVEARYDKGTLTISVPKIPGLGPRRVPVTAS